MKTIDSIKSIAMATGAILILDKDLINEIENSQPSGIMPITAKTKTHHARLLSLVIFFMY